MSLTTDVLHELFEYREGKLYRKTTIGGQLKGVEAGHLHHEGYIDVKINNKQYRVHRIIYMMFYGHIPRNMQIDHINRNRTDNRIENLRVVTHCENQWNVSEKKGYHFVAKHNKFRVRITVNRKRILIGDYNTEEEAAAAYKEAKEKYHIIKDRKHEHIEI